MIEFVLVCLAFLTMLTIAVLIVDAVRPARSRMVAADRRARWEERQLARRMRRRAPSRRRVLFRR